MNELRLTNMIENHFYLDFNWKDRNPALSVSRQQKPLFGLKPLHDTDRTHKSSVS